MKHGAIFDMDGTLFDTERLYQDSWMALAEEFGQIPNPDFPRAVCGSNGENMLAIIRTYYPAIDAERFRQCCIDRVARQVETAVPQKPGAREILSYLRSRGIKLAVASSNACAQIEKNLRLAGIREYFDVIAGGDEVVNSKPAPDIFLLAAERLGCAPEDCYVFEDGTNGLRAGAAAGCTTIMIPDLTPPTEELRQICAGVYDSLLDVRAAMQQGLL
ncbi:MAG: HAD family hydrolase [Butyricicoccus sp.]